MSDYERNMMLNAQRYEWLRNAASPRDEASIWVARGLPQFGVAHWSGNDLDVAIDVEINEAMKPIDARAELVQALETIVSMDQSSRTVQERFNAFGEAVSIARWALSQLGEKL